MDLPDAKRKIATLESLSPSQIAAVRSIPVHGTVSAAEVDDRRPVSIYLDGARFAAELDLLFRKSPVAIAPSLALPEPGMFLAHDGYGLPLLVTRDKGGQARVFLNACKHRGAKVVERCDAFKGRSVSCPYHAWTYGLDGALVGIPRQETFPTVDKAGHGLTELPAKEMGGLIWAILDRHAPADFSGISDEMIVDLDALGLGEAHLYDQFTQKVAANWKLVLEPFLEGYHVQRLHQASVGPMFADVPTVNSFMGDNIRQISGKMDFSPEQLDVPGENIHKTVTITYQAFPNTVVITSPYYISVMILMPTAADQTTVNYYMLTPGPADNDKAVELYARSFGLIQSVFGTEDFRAAELSQTGIASGALEEVIFGGLETMIPRFYRSLERRLGDA